MLISLFVLRHRDLACSTDGDRHECVGRSENDWSWDRAIETGTLLRDWGGRREARLSCQIGYEDGGDGMLKLAPDEVVVSAAYVSADKATMFVEHRYESWLWLFRGRLETRSH